jgi:hypothetical protein
VARQQSHRGAASKDETLFGARQLPALRTAVQDLCWLLDHGYAVRSALELVGNRHNLTSRQRMAVARSACPASAATQRRRVERAPEDLPGRELWLDGYNVLTILESALAGGIVLRGRDGCCRDIAGIHRRYRKMDETVPVLRLIGDTAAAWGRDELPVVAGQARLKQRPPQNADPGSRRRRRLEHDGGSGLQSGPGAVGE